MRLTHPDSTDRIGAQFDSSSAFPHSDSDSSDKAITHICAETGCDDLKCCLTTAPSYWEFIILGLLCVCIHLCSNETERRAACQRSSYLCLFHNRARVWIILFYRWAASTCSRANANRKVSRVGCVKEVKTKSFSTCLLLHRLISRVCNLKNMSKSMVSRIVCCGRGS